MASINASTVGAGGVITTADASGVLELQTAGTTAVTISTTQRAAFVAGTAAAPSITTTGDTNTGIFFPAADTIAFAEGGAERMRIDIAGNLMVGTTVPRQNITSSQNSLIGTGIEIENLNSGSNTTKTTFLNFSGRDTVATYKNSGQIISAPSDNNYVGASLSFLTRGSDVLAERMRIDSAGNVGIGNSAPNVRLDVSGNATFRGDGTDAFMSLRTTFTSGFLAYFGGTSAFELINTLAGPINFSTNNITRLQLSSTGLLSLGATAVIGHFNVSSTDKNAIFAQCGNSNTGISIANTSGTAFYFAATFSNNATGNIRGSISVSGTTTAYNTTSDYRLKENVQPMSEALDKISKLKPVTYNWKEDGTDGQGFIAHELQEVFPEAVTGEKDELDEKGLIKPQSIDTSFLVATLTKAIQEQQALITSLTERIAVLENKL